MIAVQCSLTSFQSFSRVAKFLASKQFYIKFRAEFAKLAMPQRTSLSPYIIRSGVVIV